MVQVLHERPALYQPTGPDPSPPIQMTTDELQAEPARLSTR
ncbi:hypothetical protein N878_06335 [Pseudomonas sp. EGD-AK9]|nr:hypothetical protein N878_06335 [Pseudomonas sp. EGD-AK9]